MMAKFQQLAAPEVLDGDTVTLFTLVIGFDNNYETDIFNTSRNDIFKIRQRARLNMV
jgi:hypothetical protein